MRVKSVFSYYGGKSKIIDHYPPPRYPLIIEPFAGAAAYSWRHREGRNIWVNDYDHRTAAIWEFLTMPGALDLAREFIPATVEAGTRVNELPTCHLGQLELMRAEANQGTQGARGVHSQVTSMGAKCWPRLRQKLEVVIPAVQHWHVTGNPYQYLPNFEATWFIDPPYSNEAGKRYREADLNYERLAEWALSRRGQVIVCEAAGANWLPFAPLGNHRRNSIRSRYQHADTREAIYVQDTCRYDTIDNLAVCGGPPGTRLVAGNEPRERATA